MSGPRWFRSFTGQGVLLVMLLLIFMPSAIATLSQSVRVELKGLGDLLPLLENNLQIIRATREAEPPSDELQRLISMTPEQIRDLLATEGYFSPQISKAPIDDNAEPGNPKIIRFTIKPGAPTLVTNIDIQFDGHIANDTAAVTRLADLRARWLLKAGRVFRQAQWDAAKNDLLAALLVRNYPSAQITNSRARIVPEAQRAELSVTVNSGPTFSFGPLEVYGLERYSRKMLDNLNMIRQGEPYSQERLSELQARVLGTGYFRSAFATIDPDPAKAASVPVRLDVSEVERKRLSVGLGLSTDTGPRAQLKWLDRHFMRRDWRLESVLRVDRQTQLAGAEVYFPALEQGFLDGHLRGWIPSLGTNYEHAELTGETVDKIRNTARLATPSRRDERVLSASFLLDRRAIHGQEIAIRKALVAGYSYVRRRLDEPVAPRSGYVASIELSAGLGGVLSHRSIARVLAQGLWLQPVGQRWTSVIRAQIGQIVGANINDTPADLLFRTGGDQSVRGYAFGSLGVPFGAAIVGGNVMAVASAELVYQINPQWGAAVFTDTGNAAASWQTFRFRQGSGVGARWRSPIGAVNIDIARGYDTGETRLHFSVGYGF